MMYKISDLLDLEHTIAAELFEGKTYAWEVLPEIKSFILKLGASLPEGETSPVSTAASASAQRMPSTAADMMPPA